MANLLALGRFDLRYSTISPYFTSPFRQRNEKANNEDPFIRMNAAAPLQPAMRSHDGGTSPLNRANVAIGLAISLLAHIAFVAWTFHQKINNPRTDRAAIPLEVRLLRPLPPPVVDNFPPSPPPVPDKKKTTKAPEIGKVTMARAPTPVVNDLGKPSSVTVTVPPPATAEQKHVDMNAIHASIKSAVADVDREYADTPTGQLVAKPLYPPPDETRMGKMINGTTRADCKEQVAGMGLLAPLGALATLLDKKDNGCKWR